MANRRGKTGNSHRSPKSLRMLPAATKFKDLLLGRKAMTNLDRVLKSRDHFVDKGPYSKSYAFSSSHVQMWELDHKEGWTSKNWCFWTVVLEKILESPLDSKEMKQANPKGNQPWLLIGRNVAETEAPILWPPDARSRNWKDLNAGKDWEQDEKRAIEDEIIGWHH